MSNRSGQDHLGPNDPSYYAPRRLRERSTSSASPEQIRPSPFDPTAPSSFDSPLGNIASDLKWHPLATTVQLAKRTREKRRAALFSGVSVVAGVLGIWAIIAVYYVVMAATSRPVDPGSTSSEIPQSMMSIAPQAGQGEGSKPALAQFQAILAPAPPRHDAAQGQSEQLLQRFLRWGQKPDATETSR